MASIGSSQREHVNLAVPRQKAINRANDPNDSRKEDLGPGPLPLHDTLYTPAGALSLQGPPESSLHVHHTPVLLYPFRRLPLKY